MRDTSSGYPSINAVAWLVWLIGIALIPLISRNPFYLFLCFTCVVVVYSTMTPKVGTASAWRLFAVTGSIVALISIGFNVLTVHVGDRLIAQLPDWLPVIGGKLTYNALLYGISSALAISTLLFAAAAFNTSARHADLIRLLPASFSRFGIAGSIALSFVPAMIGAARDIYDTQRARGHRLRNTRDAHGFIMPLFSTGLERAMVLSEALETRGFGAPLANTTTFWRKQGAYIASGLLLLLALLLLANGLLLPGLLVVAASVSVAVLIPGNTATRTRYQRTHWNLPSAIVVSGALLPILLVGLHFISAFSLSYSPFPVFRVPPFNPLAGVAIVGLLAPALWGR